MNRFLSRRISAGSLVLLVALLTATLYNAKFWTALTAAAGGLTLARLPMLGGVFLILLLFFNALLTLVTFRYVAKPVLVVLMLVAAVAGYFSFAYGVAMEETMIRNVFETDVREAAELVNWRMLAAVGLFGVLPAALVIRADIQYPEGWRGVLRRVAIAAGSLLLAAGIVLLLFKSLAPVLREHRELRFFLTPTSTINAVHRYAESRWSTPVVVEPLGRDAARGASWAGQKRRTVTVIVLGETARAMNFSLNGYPRETNPLLAREAGLINFPNVQSCGTATAVSVPCVFSAMGRKDYSAEKAASQEGLLDVLAHAGFTVLWRDNNSGCKGACDRVKYEDLAKPAPGAKFCNGEECYDERLLEGLPQRIREARGDVVVVLHQKGSHGPDYARRYPAGFGRFGPVCATGQLEQCTREAIAAAYDNTILYTDTFLAKTVDLLRDTAAHEGMDTAMLYFSDHGESLGENNLYLHGAPYMLAPPEQTHVPMMLWMSDGFSERFGIDRQCLVGRRTEALSHDNVFHSVLGMLDVKSRVVKPELDLFRPCVRATAPAPVTAAAP